MTSAPAATGSRGAAVSAPAVVGGFKQHFGEIKNKLFF